MVSTPPITAEDLFAMGSDAPHELIAGEQREERPSSIESSMIAAALIERIAPFVRERRLGVVTGA